MDSKEISRAKIPFRNHVSATPINRVFSRSQLEEQYFKKKNYTTDGKYVGRLCTPKDGEIYLRNKPLGLWYSLGDHWLNFDNSEPKDSYEYNGYLYEVRIPMDSSEKGRVIETTRFTNIQNPNIDKLLVLTGNTDKFLFY